MTKEEKLKIKEDKDKQEEPFLYATIDGRKERVGNFRVEPPGLFRGRGEHPKMGKLKKRIMPKDVIINIGEKAPVPPCPIPGHKWGEVHILLTRPHPHNLITRICTCWLQVSHNAAPATVKNERSLFVVRAGDPQPHGDVAGWLEG
jgi:DNA topoisomerase IB